MRLNSLILSVTNEFDDGYRVHHAPVRKWTMSLEQIRGLVDQANHLACHTVIFSGGEPFLLGDLLQEAISYAAFRVSRVRVITGAYWADTPHHALEMAGRLYQSGLTEMDIRFADWNQEPAYQQRGKWATMAAQKVGITVFADHIMVRNGRKVSMVHIKEFPESTGERYLGAVESGHLRDHRHAMSLLPYDPEARDEPSSDELLFLQKADRSHCPYIFNTLTAHADGRLSACGGQGCGVADELTIGDWHKTRLNELVDRAEGNPLLQWIRLSGPVALRDYVREQGKVECGKGYANLCHLCAELLSGPETKRLLHAGAQEEVRRVIDQKMATLIALKEKAAPRLPIMEGEFL